MIRWSFPSNSFLWFDSITTNFQTCFWCNLWERLHISGRADALSTTWIYLEIRGPKKDPVEEHLVARRLHPFRMIELALWSSWRIVWSEEVQVVNACGSLDMRRQQCDSDPRGMHYVWVDNEPETLVNDFMQNLSLHSATTGYLLGYSTAQIFQIAEWLPVGPSEVIAVVEKFVFIYEPQWIVKYFVPIGLTSSHLQNPTLFPWGLDR